MPGPSARRGRRCVRGARQRYSARAGPTSFAKLAGLSSRASKSCAGVGEPEGLQPRGPALRVLSEQHEVAGVGDEHEAVPTPVAAHLIAVRGQPCVVAYGLDLDHAALGKLSLSRSALLRLAGGVESEVGVARALVGELGDAGHLGLERGADGFEQVAERRVVGALAGGAAGCSDGTEVGEVGLDGGGEPGCGWRHCHNVAEGDGKCKAWGRGASAERAEGKGGMGAESHGTGHGRVSNPPLRHCGRGPLGRGI